MVENICLPIIHSADQLKRSLGPLGLVVKLFTPMNISQVRFIFESLFLSWQPNILARIKLFKVSTDIPLVIEDMHHAIETNILYNATTREKKLVLIAFHHLVSEIAPKLYERDAFQ